MFFFLFKIKTESSAANSSSTFSLYIATPRASSSSYFLDAAEHVSSNSADPNIVWKI
jgi:hypothetical protein